MKKTALIFLSLMLIFLCSCRDSREIDQSAYVIAIGIDKGDDIFRYTFQISDPLAMENKGNGESENSCVQNIVIGAKSFPEAKTALNNFLSKKPTLSHLKLIAASYKTASGSLLPHIEFLLEEREVRPSTHLCITENAAEDFLRGINPALEANTAEYYDAIFKNGSLLAPDKTLREFLNESSLSASALPLGRASSYEQSTDFAASTEEPLRISSSKSEFFGVCLVKDFRAVGVLSPFQSELFSILTNGKSYISFTLNKNGEKCTVKATPKRKAAFTLLQTENAFTVNMSADFFAEVSPKSAPISSEDIEEYLKKEIYSLFNAARAADCDIFGTEKARLRQCDTISEHKALLKRQSFFEAYFSPDITVTIKNEV